MIFCTRLLTALTKTWPNVLFFVPGIAFGMIYRQLRLLLGKFGPYRLNIFGKKKRKRKTPGGQASGWIENMCANFRVFSPENRVDIWTLLRKSV